MLGYSLRLFLGCESVQPRLLDGALVPGLLSQAVFICSRPNSDGENRALHLQGLVKDAQWMFAASTPLPPPTRRLLSTLDQILHISKPQSPDEVGYQQMWGHWLVEEAQLPVLEAEIAQGFPLARASTGFNTLFKV